MSTQGPIADTIVSKLAAVLPGREVSVDTSSQPGTAIVYVLGATPEDLDLARTSLAEGERPGNYIVQRDDSARWGEFNWAASESGLPDI